MDSDMLPLTPIQMHVLLMSIAWALLIPIAMSSAAFKSIYGSGTLCGMARWFTIHRTCAVSSFPPRGVSSLVFVQGIKKHNGTGT